MKKVMRTMVRSTMTLVRTRNVSQSVACKVVLLGDGARKEAAGV
jgi:hypothetical protein